MSGARLSPLDATRCPVCSNLNSCAMEKQRTTGKQQPPCWCTQASFDTELLLKVPAAARGQVCICPTCAMRASQAAG